MKILEGIICKSSAILFSQSQFCAVYVIHMDTYPFTSKKRMIPANDFSFKKCHKGILWVYTLHTYGTWTCGTLESCLHQ